MLRPRRSAVAVLLIVPRTKPLSRPFDVPMPAARFASIPTRAQTPRRNRAAGMNWRVKNLNEGERANRSALKSYGTRQPLGARQASVSVFDHHPRDRLPGRANLRRISMQDSRFSRRRQAAIARGITNCRGKANLRPARPRPAHDTPLADRSAILCPAPDPTASFCPCRPSPAD